MHNGTVRILSDGKYGTCMEVVLPVTQSTGDKESQADMQTVSQLREPDSKPLLLIVEDNLEIASFIAKSLSGEFTCITAQNGKIGLEMAITRQPDIIIADIMMPVMDGIEMCRRLKDSIATSLTPVVMLTAKDDKNTELMGYRTDSCGLHQVSQT
jgi:CheY-like chemotaxis protein